MRICSETPFGIVLTFVIDSLACLTQISWLFAALWLFAECGLQPRRWILRHCDWQSQWRCFSRCATRQVQCFQLIQSLIHGHSFARETVSFRRRLVGRRSLRNIHAFDLWNVGFLVYVWIDPRNFAGWLAFTGQVCHYGDEITYLLCTLSSHNGQWLVWHFVLAGCFTFTFCCLLWILIYFYCFWSQCLFPRKFDSQSIVVGSDEFSLWEFILVLAVVLVIWLILIFCMDGFFTSPRPGSRLIAGWKLSILLNGLQSSSLSCRSSHSF